MEQKQPIVSIIVPCYNQAQFISQCLDSILAQTYTDWECIVIDDGSSDNSFNVAKEYCRKDSRFKCIHQENQGPSVARNNGILQSKGEFILPLDADDKIAETYLEKALSVFETQPNVKLVYCKADKFGIENREWILPEYKYENLLWENMIFCSALYRRRDYDKTNGYNPNMKNGLEDWDFWLSLLQPADRVYRIEEVLFHYRVNESSRSTQVSHNINRALLEQIYYNHKEIYAPYLHEIVFLKNEEKQFEQIKNQAVYEKEVQLRSTKAYRLGRAILKPFKWLICKR